MVGLGLIWFYQKKVGSLKLWKFNKVVAKQLLKDNQSVTAVCFEVGFDSVPSFTNLFKRQVGCSPKAYATQHQQQLQASQTTPLQYVPNCFVENFNWDKGGK